MRKKSKKLAKLERERFSVFYDDLTRCCYCGSAYQMTKHEIFEGSKRINSMKYGFVLPLCWKCHQELQDNFEFSEMWKKKAQQYFEDNIGSREEFLKLFTKNRL